MSSSSEETHDDDEQGRTSTGCKGKAAQPERLSVGQESTGAGSKPSLAVSNQQAGDSDPKSRKRNLEELKATELPEDEQHSSQSAFQQYRPQAQQNSTQLPRALPVTSHPQALHLNAAQTYEGASHLNWGNEKGSLPAPATQHASRITGKTASANSEPSSLNKVSLPAWLSRLAPQGSQSQHQQKSNEIDVMYAPTKPASRITAQLIWDIQRLEHPEMDADSVQAALEFADAIQINPAQHAKQLNHTPSLEFPSQHPAEQVSLRHTLEISTGRLDVLNNLLLRVRSSTISSLAHGISGPGQLLDIIQDLLKDMEASHYLLQHAEQAVLAYKQAALSRMESLQTHRRATQDYWLQSQRLQDIAAQRRAVLQRMLRLQPESPSRELLELFEGLRGNVVGELEVLACRAKLSSDMQSAQAKLVAQGVSGVTSQGMINGAVELAVNRPVVRLQTLLRIVHAIGNTRAALLGDLASALSHGPWYQRSQHMHEDGYKVAEAVSQLQARVEGLLHQGWTASGPGRSQLAPIQTSLTSTPAVSHNSSKAAKLWDQQSPHERPSCSTAEAPRTSPALCRSLDNISGGHSPADPSPRSNLSLHLSRGNPSLASKASKIGAGVGSVKEPSDAALVQGPFQAVAQNGTHDHTLIRPRAQRPQSGFSQYESRRDPRAQQVPVSSTRPETPQEGLSGPPRASVDQHQGRAGPQQPSDAPNPHALTGTDQSPEVLAAAQALLRSQLQQAGVKPEDLPPQLLGLFNPPGAHPSTAKLPQKASIAFGPNHRFDSPLNHAHHHSPSQPLAEDRNPSRTVMQNGSEAEKAPNFGWTDSSRGLKEIGSMRESGFAAGQTADHGSVQAVNHDSMRIYSGGIGQHDLQAHANASYAHHLYGLLAAQAQAVNGRSAAPAHNDTPNPMNRNMHVPKHRLVQQ